ncbi:MAG: DUF3102 domain-containing protein [Wohlfahrtiimonas sp.]
MVDENDKVTIDIEEAIEGTVEEKPVQISTQLAEIQETYGNNLPYNRDRVVSETQIFMTQSATAMFEAGKRLVLLKEHEPHGDFINIIEGDLGLSRRTAQVMMQASIRYMSIGESKAQALALLGRTKLLELMTQESEDLESLAEGGTVAGLSLDDMDAMTTRELKAALKKAKEETEAARRVASQKDEKINKLDEEVAKLEIKAKKQNAEAERLKLDNDPAIETMKSCQVTLASVSGDISASINELNQIFTKAQNEFVPASFFKEMALTASQLRDDLDALLESLPEDIEPVDTSWMKQE